MMMNKKIFSKKAGISYFEISVLIIAVFAFSYIAYQSSGIMDKIDEAYKKIDNAKSQGVLTQNLAQKIIDEINKPLIPVVSAAAKTTEPSFSCCELTKKNEKCADIIETSECTAGSKLVSSKCDKTSFCRVGCCVDETTGIYTKNTLLGECKTGKWIQDDKNCNAEKLGCCTVSGKTYFTNNQNCKWRTAKEGNGTSVDWKANMNEVQCVLSSATQELGACVSQSGSVKNCKFTTQKDCITLTGSLSNFYEDVLCTSTSLNTTCKKTDKTMCVDGKDQVYFADSCGNPGNIYDALKINNANYWNKVVSSDDSCNSKSGNANSKTCGNCNRFLGGMCSSVVNSTLKPQIGNFYCKDTSCTFKGTSYKNGESWCVYDGAIGNGDDVVGSRHWKYVCNQGEIQIEPCADYRNQICIQSNTVDVTTNNSSLNVSFKNAACVANNWRECIDLNSQKGNISQCKKTLNCQLQHYDIADKFFFDICTPKYPGGFSLTSEGEQDAAKQLCGLATQTCTVMYKQTLMGSCEVVANGDCLEAGFTQKMNDFCRKLGDCGGEVNIEGKFTKNYKLSKAVPLDKNWITKLVALAKPVPGQYAQVENYTKYLEAAGLLGPNVKAPSGGKSGGSNIGTIGGAVIGGLGGVIVAAYWSGTTGASIIMGIAGSLETSSGVLVGFSTGAIGAGIGMIAGTMLAKALGLSPMGGILMGMGGALMGFSAAIGAAGMGGFGSGAAALTQQYLGFLFPYLWPIAIIGMILAIASLFFGGDMCPPVKVKYTCQPWQPPSGGSDCEKCNNDPLKPCSEYRCESLGAACKLVNKGTTEEMCDEDNPGDVIAPTITPSLGTISEGTKYSEIDSKGFAITNLQNGCVDAYTNLVWGINTNELSQCRFDTEMKSFDDMAQDLGSSAYVYNHTTIFALPDPSHGQSQGLNWTGKLTFYIKCKDTHGNEAPVGSFYTIDMCVNQGQDTTPPAILITNPITNNIISFNATEQNISVITNEPADCRWSETDQDYSIMENSMDCLNYYQDQSDLNSCSAIVPASLSENTFYIRCEDQPWLSGENASGRNANSQSYVYVLKKPETPLAITGIIPNEDFESSTSLTSVVLKVQTAGGAGGEVTGCSYSFSGYEDMISFFDTYSTQHQQEFNLQSGTYRIYVECTDSTGDKARTQTEFEIIYTTNSPDIARIYTLGGSLKIITNREGDCRISTDMNADFGNYSSMGIGLTHSASVNAGKVYFIKCRDKFSRMETESMTTVRVNSI